MMVQPTTRRGRLYAAVVTGLLIAAVQLWLVAVAGTDVPFYDQWDVEGAGMVPDLREGTFSWSRVLDPHNEHRIVSTHLLNAALLCANGGQWDPLVQQAANALLHGAVAGLLVGLATVGMGRIVTATAAAVVVVASLPLPGWHNALWGFQSQVYFVIAFSVLAMALLGETRPTGAGRFVGGVLAAIAAMGSMGPGFLVPLALLLWEAVRWRDGTRERWRWFCWIVLFGWAWFLKRAVPAHDVLRADTAAELFGALGRVLAWPHTSQPWAAWVVVLPLAVLSLARLRGVVPPHPARDRMLTIALWACLVGMAAAWSRGGSDEFASGVPSRYADFFVLLPLAGAGVLASAWTLYPERHRRLLRVSVAAWGGFIVLGWLGLSTEAWRRVIVPRMSDREAPERLMTEFRRTYDPAVYVGMPRLLVPHPSLESVARVLGDPRVDGALPPSFQPQRQPGLLSRWTRALLGRRSEVQGRGE